MSRLSNQPTLTQLWAESGGEDDESTHSSRTSHNTVPKEYDEHIVYDDVASFQQDVVQKHLTQLTRLMHCKHCTCLNIQYVYIKHLNNMQHLFNP